MAKCYEREQLRAHTYLNLKPGFQSNMTIPDMSITPVSPPSPYLKHGGNTDSSRLE